RPARPRAPEPEPETLRREQPPVTTRAKLLDLARAHVLAVVAGWIVERDRHLQRAPHRRLEFHSLAVRTEAGAVLLLLGDDLDLDVLDSLDARDLMLAVPEHEGAVHVHELRGGRPGAEELGAVRLPDLDEDV